MRVGNLEFGGSDIFSLLMKKDLVIIKLGGSVITDKSKGRGAFRKVVVRRLVGEIVEAKKKKDSNLILIHGAGSYPHFLTMRYQLGRGYLGAESLEGFSRVKLELSRLNSLIWAECLKAGLAVSTVSVSAVILTKNGKIKSFDTHIIEKLLKLGITPVMHGDDTIDSVKGIAVLSGDRIVAYLAKKFGAKKVIFVSDVDGVFDKNPKVYKDAKLVKEINNRNFDSVINSMEVFNKNDASGEMKGKLLAIGEELSGFKVQIIGGFSKTSLGTVLVGKESGTTIFL